MEINKQTWDELRSLPTGTILHDETADGIRFIIMRGPVSLTAYVGLPLGHPLANRNYDAIDVDAHGGLTWGKEGDGKNWPVDLYWYGWDYAHAGDYAFYYDKHPRPSFAADTDDKKWLVEDVLADSQKTLADFKRLAQQNGVD